VTRCAIEISTRRRKDGPRRSGASWYDPAVAVTESERVNLPVFRGRTGTFESWMILLFEPKRHRGYWLRYEVVVPSVDTAPAAAGILAVHVFDARSSESIRFAKRIVPLEQVGFGPETRFHVRFDDSEIGHGFARGSAGEGEDTIRWNLRFTTQREPSERTPSLLRHLPLPTQREYPHTEVRFDGTIAIGDDVQEIRWAVGAQLHAYGERRVEERRWVYFPEFAGDENAALELVQTRLEKKVLGLPAPAFASIWLKTASEELDLTELRDGWMHRVDSLATGSIHARSISANRAIVVHAHAPHATLAAHRIHDPDGRDRYVAKSAVADVSVEIFERPSRFGRFRPKQVLVARGAGAVEILGSEPSSDMSYCEYDEPRLPSKKSRESVRAPAIPSVRGHFEPFPANAHAIYAASFSYPTDGEEFAPVHGNEKVVLLAKSYKSLLAAGDVVRIPDSNTIVESLLAIEPDLSKVLGSRYGFLPALLDYEVELGLIVLERITREDLDDPGFLPRIGWFVANDLTARVCQLFGAGQKDPRPYWELGKSFAGFCPVSSTIFIPERLRLDSWPDIALRTIVNGQYRQQANTQQIVHTPREFLTACVRRRGVLEPGVAILTGSPTGVAYRVSAWRRAIEDRLLDRFGKLEAAFGLYLESPDFLRPGDRVVVDAGFLGAREVFIG